ncbi:zinc finger protein JACKDAW [Coffea eugenioides]|uniref:Zinc finger protein JACKDAW-like n=1 Tax=Coffea arabica TaxID=13443 RepID=A0ABM4UTA3_COFAR|nr:zinc finger protein JACKDAW [Coffea eugenioides]
MLVMSANMFTVPPSVNGFSPEPADTNPTSSTSNPKSNSTTTNPAGKKKRNLPGNPDPDAEVMALSPKTLMATNRFICEICNKGFQREQNLQLHRRGHNLPWKLKQRTTKEPVKRKVYICPEKTCVHHDPSRALGDLTGIKKHFSRKHGEKKWKCEKCSKKYAVQSDWKAHSKTCGTREYKCDCGTLFSRKDSFITHRAFCDALAEESARITSVAANNFNFKTDQQHLNGGALLNHPGSFPHGLSGPTGISQIGVDFATGNQLKPRLSLWLDQASNHQLNHADMPPSQNLYMPSASHHDIMQMSSAADVFGNYGMPWQQLEKSSAPPSSAPSSSAANLSLSPMMPQQVLKDEGAGGSINTQTLSSLYSPGAASNNDISHSKSSATPMSATALLQKAAQMGSSKSTAAIFGNGFGIMNPSSSSSSPAAAANMIAFSSGLAQNRTEMMQVFGKQTDNMMGGGSNMTSSTSSTLTNNLDHQPMVQTSTAADSQSVASLGGFHRHPGFNAVVEHASLTRDFLGMGGDGGRPFLPHELAKFASMSSAMGLGHFSSNH